MAAPAASIWQTLADLGHPLGLAMRQLAAGLLAPNSASEADSLASTLGRIAGVGPVSSGLHSRYTTPPLAMPAAMMGFEGGPLRLPKLPSALPMGAQKLLFQHPELPLPHFEGNPEAGPTALGFVGYSPEEMARPYGTGGLGMKPQVGEPAISDPKAWKPVPGVQQNLGPIGDLPVQNSKQSLATEQTSIVGDRFFRGNVGTNAPLGTIIKHNHPVFGTSTWKKVGANQWQEMLPGLPTGPVGTKAPTSPPTPSQPPSAPLPTEWDSPAKSFGIAPNSPEVTQKLHDGYLNIWRNLSPSPQLQNAFETNLKRFIEDASRAGSTHDKAELDGARRAWESIQRLKQPPPQGPNFGRQEW